MLPHLKMFPNDFSGRPPKPPLRGPMSHAWIDPGDDATSRLGDVPVIANLHVAGFGASPAGPQRSGGGTQRLDAAKPATWPAAGMPVTGGANERDHADRMSADKWRINLDMRMKF